VPHKLTPKELKMLTDIQDAEHPAMDPAEKKMISAVKRKIKELTACLLSGVTKQKKGRTTGTDLKKKKDTDPKKKDTDPKKKKDPKKQKDTNPKKKKTSTGTDHKKNSSNNKENIAGSSNGGKKRKIDWSEYLDEEEEDEYEYVKEQSKYSDKDDGNEPYRR
jgi:hypothetical protein